MAAIDRQRWLVLSPLLDELLEVDAATRASRLAAIRRDDDSLGEELAVLLAHESAVETQQFLEGSALSVPDLETLAGQVIGNYTLERPLGQGGMGSVWLARRSDGRYEGRAAVKFLSLALIGQGGLERFKREGSVLARLAHPNIARLLDAGIASGQPYLVLEYVDGEPIDRYCDAHALTVEARVRLFLDVLAAVGHAHSNLILHRDLKPSNILVTPQGQVKLLDFGIAKLINDESAGSAETELTQAAGRAFTPEYAAPEQVQGTDVTTATDVYSLGVLLNVLLTGSHPTAVPGRPKVEQLRALVETEPTKSSDTAMRAAPESARHRSTTPPQLARALRGDLDNIIAKALKKNPSERYPTIDAFAADLLRHLQHEPIQARADSLGYLVGKFVRRHRVVVASAAITLVALVAGVVGTTWQAIEARRAQARAESSAEDAKRQKTAAEFEAKVARANHEFLSQVFGDAMRGGESTRMRQRLDRARELLRRRYASEPEVHAILLLQLAGRYAELGDSKREGEVLQEIETIAQTSGSRALQSSMQCIRAYDLIAERKLDEAAPFLERGLALMNNVDGLQGSAEFECIRADAMMAALRKDPARATKRMTDYLEQLERAGNARTRLYLSTLGSLAYVQVLAGELAPAVATTRRTIALEETLGSSSTLAAVIDFDRLAALLMDLGRFADSAAADDKLVRGFKEADETMSAQQRAATGRRSLLAGKAQEAMETFRDLVPRFEKDGPENYLRGSMLDLAEAYWQLRRPADAEAMLRRFEARLASKSASPLETIESTRLRGLIALERKDVAAARSHAQALARAVDWAPELRRAAGLRGRLAAGWLFFRTGQIEPAQQQAEIALAKAKEKTLDGQPSAWVGAANLLLAHVQSARGDTASATQMLQLARTELDASVAAEHPLRRLAALPADAAR